MRTRRKKKLIYAKWLDYWLKNYVMLSAKPRTCARYSEVVRVYLVPSLGGYDMDALTPAVMQRFVTGLAERGGKQGGIGGRISAVLPRGIGLDPPLVSVLSGTARPRVLH